MPSNAEAGIRRGGTYWVPETVDPDTAEPITPTDPQFRLYSSVVESTEEEPQADFEERTGKGNYIPAKKNRQQENHTISVTYDCERFPVDSSGTIVDAFGHVAKRDIDNRLKTSHTYLEVEEKGSILPRSTWHERYFNRLGNSHPTGSVPEATSKATRLEAYARGCVPSEASLSFDPGDSGVVGVELEYTAHKYRKYQIDQPESEYLHLRSSDPADTDVTVDIESDDGSKSASIALDSSDATTTVATSATFSSLRVWVPDDQLGSIEIYGDDGSGSGSPGNPDQLLTVIRGKNDRDGIESDNGVPLVGSGTWESESALEGAQMALGTRLNWMGHKAAEKLSSTTITVSNELAENNTDSGLVKDIRAVNQTIDAESTLFGETETPEKFGDHIAGREGALSLAMTDGTVDIPRGYVKSPGSIEHDENQAVVQSDVTWGTLMPSDGSDPIQFTHA